MTLDRKLHKCVLNSIKTIAVDIEKIKNLIFDATFNDDYLIVDNGVFLKIRPFKQVSILYTPDHDYEVSFIVNDSKLSKDMWVTYKLSEYKSRWFIVPASLYFDFIGEAKGL